MTRIAPVLVLVMVTTLLLAFGTHPWSWLAGPLAAVALWSIDRKAHEPHARRGPAPVD